MKLSNYFVIFRVAGRFLRAYSEAIKAEEEKDGDVSWLDRVSCLLEALQTMDERDLDAILKVAKQPGKK